MKIRKGFVSNSSSSSFIIRGTMVDKVDVYTLLGMDLTEDHENVWDNMHEFIKKADVNLDFNPNEDYFTEESNPTQWIIGQRIGELPDGKVVELKEPSGLTDSKIIGDLRKLGIMATELKTYAQMVSNDNW